MYTVIPDNDELFINLIVTQARKLDPTCIIDIQSRLTSHTISIQTAQEFKVRMMNVIKDLHFKFNIPFIASQFIKDRQTIVSFELQTVY
jgi:hypothetical protein